METSNNDPIIYEETPIIKPIEEKKLPDPLDTPEISSHNRHGKQPPSGIGRVLFFLLLFVIGVVGSTFVRPFLDGVSFPTFPAKTQKTNDPVETPAPRVVPADRTAGWGDYVINAGPHVLTYRLPPSVLPPICDGQTCPSEGTYLEGGTRLTVSSKITQPIINFAKLIVKDAGGRVFETKEATVSGLTAVDFSGTFTGQTTGGYSFTRMHGVMIMIAPTITVEINHFAPNGIAVDFDADDAMFTQILKTVNITSTSSATVK
jgi:hypothetical protein